MVLEVYPLSLSKPVPRCMPCKGRIFGLSVYAVPKFPNPIYQSCRKLLPASHGMINPYHSLLNEVKEHITRYVHPQDTLHRRLRGGVWSWYRGFREEILFCL